MHAYQRLMNTLLGQPVDRVPVLAVLGAYGGKLTNTDLTTLYRDPAAWVAGQQAAQDTFGFDLVMPPFDYSAIAEAFGGTVAWFDNQPPNMKRPAVDNAQAALKLPLPDPARNGRLPAILDSTRMLAAQYKETVPIIGVVPGPAILPSLVIGMGPWMETILFDRPTAQKLLEQTGPFFVAWCTALLQAGVDCLVVTEGLAAAEIAPRSLFAELALPHLRSTFAQVPGPKVMHQTGGSINHVIDLLPGLDGLVAVAVGSRDDLSQARVLAGPALNLIGNLDNLAFPALSAQDLYHKAMDCLHSAAPAGHYILANAGADIALTTPPENLHALLAASRDYAAGAGRPR